MPGQRLFDARSERRAAMRDAGAGALDQVLGLYRPSVSVLVEQMGVRASALLDGVACLFSDVGDRATLLDQQRHESVAQVVGTGTVVTPPLAAVGQPLDRARRDARRDRGGPKDAAAPVAVVGVAPGVAVRPREQERAACHAVATGPEPVGGEVLRHGPQEVDGTDAVGLGVLLLAERYVRLDQQGAVADGGVGER